ncbi:hypothetical protein CPY51_05695 [Rhizobium tubonense]|uniref:Uncharacterized protein n=1 Tax=Rhizobium tubonense TaxID=484088 RepID=A0A2W4CYM4_9HYPH|nr:hypothetical protein CPY51_05695 [Rhizobium tubonense]
MTAKSSIAFSIAFVACGMFYFSEAFFSYYIGDIYANYIYKILFLPFFISFIFGVASPLITISVKNTNNSTEDIEYFKTNPIIWFLVWREIREEVDRG